MLDQKGENFDIIRVQVDARGKKRVKVIDVRGIIIC